MSTFVDALRQANRDKQTLVYLLVGAMALAGYAMWGWNQAPTHLQIHVPPDLRNGATIQANASPEVPDTTVYTFAFYIWQQINHWQKIGRAHV